MNRDTAPYVKAVLDTALEPWLKSLRHVDRRLREADLASRLDDATVPMAEKKAKLAPILGDTPLAMANLVYTLAANGHVHLLEGMLSELSRQLELVGGGVSGVVRSAVPLTEEQRQRLTEKLSTQFGSDLVLSYEIDPTLIGGLVVRVGDLVMDGSVATRLATLKEQIS